MELLRAAGPLGYLFLQNQSQGTLMEAVTQEPGVSCICLTAEQRPVDAETWRQALQRTDPAVHGPGHVRSMVQAAHDDAGEVQRLGEVAHQGALEPQHVPPVPHQRRKNTI